MPFAKENRANTLNGILFMALFALASMYLAEIPLFAHAGISSLVLAIVLGIFYSNTLGHRLPSEWRAGVQFSAKRLLRLAIILYGFRVTFGQIIEVGSAGLIIDILIVVLTLGLGTFIGMKLFKLDRHTAILISAGSAICGAAAVLAVEDVLKSAPHKTAVAVGTVVLFGTTAMFLYPFLQHLGLFGFTEHQYGIFAGATVHEVAQAVVAGNGVSVEASNTAVIVKMTRVLLLVPVLLLLSLYESRFTKHINSEKKPLTVPWFAIGFAAIIGFNSLHILPATLIPYINQLDTFLLTMAMAAIGVETNLGKIKNVGIKPLYLAILLFVWLMMSGYGLTHGLVAA